MRLAARFMVVLVACGVLLALPGGAFADDGLVLATEEPAEDETPETTTFAPGEEPAEVAPPQSEADEELPWTKRFIAPTILILGVLATVGFFAYYGFRLRSRYEVVE